MICFNMKLQTPAPSWVAVLFYVRVDLLIPLEVIFVKGDVLNVLDTR